MIQTPTGVRGPEDGQSRLGEGRMAVPVVLECSRTRRAAVKTRFNTPFKEHDQYEKNRHRIEFRPHSHSGRPIPPLGRQT